MGRKQKIHAPLETGANVFPGKGFVALDENVLHQSKIPNDGFLGWRQLCSMSNPESQKEPNQSLARFYGFKR
jgi:hypothetical protein